MKTWLSADYHLGENRFELMGRPFTTQKEHNDYLVQEHNKLVQPDDLVIVNGDAVYQKTPEFLSDISRFNGKKILIRGNHDRVFTDEQLKPYFEKIIPEGFGMEIDCDDLRCYVTHYPSQGSYTRFNLVGHVHAAWKYQLNMFNIGVDVNSFRPVNLNKIQFHYDAITKFYDDDVWAAYNACNMDYVGFRGKKGTYFTK